MIVSPDLPVDHELVGMACIVELISKFEIITANIARILFVPLAKGDFSSQTGCPQGAA